MFKGMTERGLRGIEMQQFMFRCTKERYFCGEQCPQTNGKEKQRKIKIILMLDLVEYVLILLFAQYMTQNLLKVDGYMVEVSKMFPNLGGSYIDGPFQLLGRR